MEVPRTREKCCMFLAAAVEDLWLQGYKLATRTSKAKEIAKDRQVDKSDIFAGPSVIRPLVFSPLL